MESKHFFSKEEQKSIVNAIVEAELNTSGEIRVHIEPTCKDPLIRAALVFKRLKMHKTALRNGVLIYIATKSRKIAIIGDKGINEKVPEDYWDDIIAELQIAFKNGNAAEGVCKAISSVGNNLKEFFPYQQGDINEQSDEISFGK